jgi:hypothetical protein
VRNQKAASKLAGRLARFKINEEPTANTSRQRKLILAHV